MTISPNAPTKHALGHVAETSDITAFFGDWRSTPAALTTTFPEYNLAFLKQTHSNTVVTASTVSTPEADSHVTSKRKLAICIRTADCLPVLIYEPNIRVVAAIHAGWRGIEGQIIQNTCAHLKSLGGQLWNAFAWIGPHIGPESFEVGQDVAAKLEASFQAVRGHSRLASALREHREPGKAYVDLLAIARAQLASEGIQQETTRTLGVDTFTSDEHASYRRDRSLAGRQISFIALK